MSTGRVRLALALGLLLWTTGARAEDGYDLWLRYPLVSNPDVLARYRAEIASVLVAGNSATAQAARDELRRGLRGLLGADVPAVTDTTGSRLLVAGTPATSPFIATLGLDDKL